MSSASQLEDALAPFLTARNVVAKPISSLSLLFFLYGTYCVIFGLSTHVLFHRRSTTHTLHKGGSIALFVMATIFTAVYTWGQVQQAFLEFDTATTKDYTPFILYLQGDNSKAAAGAILSFISTLMNSVADIMLIHRCYVVYNKKYILYPLTFTAFILNGIDLGCDIIAIVAYGDSSKQDNLSLQRKGVAIDSAVVIGEVVFQIVLSLMTGGRIWWITREAKKLARETGRQTSTRFNDLIAVIVESAFLYAATMLITLLFENFIGSSNGNSRVLVDLSVLSTLLSGLAPTMIIARVGYGKSVDSVQQTLSTFRIADDQESQQGSNARKQTVENIEIHDNALIQEEEGLPKADKDV